MGNIECCSNRKIKESSLSESEKKYLQNLYNGFIESNKALGKANFNKDTLKTLFAENPDVAEGIYHFMVYISGNTSKVDYTSFEYAVEALTKSQTTIQLKNFRDREKLDMLAALITKDFALPKDKLNSMEITYAQAIQYVKSLVAILHCENKETKPSDYLAKAVVEGSFKGDNDKVSWWTFLQYIKENLIYANRSLKEYFNMKFLDKKAHLKLPELNKTSTLFKDDLLSLQFFSNKLVQTTPKLHFIHAAHHNELSFKRICLSLENSDVSTYILMRVVPIGEGQGQGDCHNYDEEEGFIIGGFSKIPWKNTGTYRGDCDGYVFSLAPKFKNCFAMTKTTANNNFIYMETDKDNNPGIGFGGTNHNDFRIWIDGNDFDKSYVRNEDNTYYAGKLVESSPSYIKILEIEIWGFGAELLNFENTTILQKFSSAPSGGASGTGGVSAGTWITFNPIKISDLLLEASPDMESTPSNFQRRKAKKVSSKLIPKNPN